MCCCLFWVKGYAMGRGAVLSLLHMLHPLNLHQLSMCALPLQRMMHVLNV